MRNRLSKIFNRENHLSENIGEYSDDEYVLLEHDL